MSNDDLYALKATPGAEAKASCGCAFLYAEEQALDARSGSWYTAVDLVVVPCCDDHTEIARATAQPFVRRPADSRLLEEAAAAMSAKVAA